MAFRGRQLRRILFVLLILGILALPSVGYADNTITYSSLTTSEKTDMKNAILSEPTGGSGGWTDPQTWGMYVAAAGAGVEIGATDLAISSGVIEIPLAISGYADAVFGYKIANPVGGYIYRKITGESYTGSTTSPSGTVTLTGFKWVRNLATYWPTNAWAMDIRYASPTCGGTFCGDFTAFICSPGATNCDSSHTGNNGEAIPYASILQNGVANLDTANTSYGTSGSSVCPWSVKPSSCTTVYRTDAQMNATAQVRPDNSANWGALPAPDQKTVNPAVVQWPNKSSLTDADLQAALAALNAATAAAQSAAQAAAVALLKALAGIPDFTAPDCSGLTVSACQTILSGLGSTATISTTTATFTGADVTKPAGAIITQAIPPGTGMSNGTAFAVTVNPANVDMPFTLPKPYTYETYGDYITRLQNGGWVGTATEIDLSDAQTDDSVGPNGVPRITVQLNGTGSPQVLRVASWPSPLPKAKRGVAISVYKNPASSPYVPPDPTDPPNPDPGQVPGTIPDPVACASCAIDWTPIESIDYGGKFPFGFVTWVNSFFGSVPTGGSCPTLSIGKPSALGGGTLDISFCNTTWESTWRSPVFLVLEALMTLAGIVFLAQRILGSGGDEE